MSFGGLYFKGLSFQQEKHRKSAKNILWNPSMFATDVLKQTVKTIIAPSKSLKQSSSRSQSNISNYKRPAASRITPSDPSQHSRPSRNPSPLNAQPLSQANPISSSPSEGSLEIAFKNTLGLLVDKCGSLFADYNLDKVERGKGRLFSGGNLGYSQLLVISVLVSISLGGGASVAHWGLAAAQEWWASTNLVQRTAPLYMISLLPYLDFLWKLQQSKPQATREMVSAFAFILVFVVISTPVEMYSKVHLGHDVADVDPLHFLVQSLITIANFSILMAFRSKIKKVSKEKKDKAAKRKLQASAPPPSQIIKD
eukprot:CAMPEP_0196580986 /NCGR_PEP_ID=MMETSP1081-20130531/31841_1 /TAXON_ID=36882 /ORGANISM="Pyramimonas amylifera, Strain CCMP720" /LENGTH=310 /DNA_ID=CAMNT_0041901051 /DNA_START=266 /DNA_END=1199 /DNA_ORIENTATION=-